MPQCRALPLPFDSLAACVDSRRGLASACLFAVFLAACSSTPMRPADSGATSPGDNARSSPKGAAAPSVGRRGGYYKDDGPGDNPPADLDSIPDATPRLEPLSRFANRPYSALGRDYVPATALVPYRERGLASWYGRRFHGQLTSSGEPYDMYGMTAAHPTLPIPSYARVTNLANGRSVVVRINDRGPFLRDRVIDLSYTAAYRLGYVSTGSAMVEVKSILPGDMDMTDVAAASAPAGRKPSAQASAPAAIPVAARADASTAAAVPAAAATPAATPAAAPSALSAADAAAGGVFVQLGAFSSQANAEDFRDRVSEEMTGLVGRLELKRDGGRFRLHAGPYATVAEARAVADEIAAVLKLRAFVVTP